MSDRRLTALLRRALRDDGPEGENAWRILAKNVDPEAVSVAQKR